MKKAILLLVLFIPLFTMAQSWQWGRRGGSIDQINTQGGIPPEQVYSIVTDSDRNIYALSAVGITSLDIDGNPKAGFADPTTITDFAVSGFACDGTYRWSKIIGGAGPETINALQLDNEGNLYISGKFGSCSSSNNYPARIENDTILNQTSASCSLLFIAKYNGEGQMQWFRRPQEGLDSSLSYSNTGTSGMQVDGEGHVHMCVRIPPGNYGEGEFINDMPGSNYFILRYDSDGVLINAIPIDMQLEFSAGNHLRFYRNPNNGQYYFTSQKQSSHSAVVGGETVTKGFFLASFDSSGQFLWKRESTYDGMGMSAYNLAFDSEDNIYMGGRFLGLNAESFLTFSTPIAATPAYIMKLNPVADTVLWASHNNYGVSTWGGIVLKGDEVALTSYTGTTIVWGSQTLFVNNMNEGTRALLARFDKDTGSCLGLSFIPSSNGHQNLGSSITADAAGDYILGGGFGGTQTFATNTISSVGGQSDFFIAKYSTSVCSDLDVAENTTNVFDIYPNPTKGILNIAGSGTDVLSLEVYNMLGQQMIAVSGSRDLKGIDVASLTSGHYIICITTSEGTYYRKFIKE